MIHSDVNDSSTVVSDITSMTLADSAIEREKEDSAIYVYDVNEDIEGLVNLYLPPGKKTDHMGIKMHLFGRIELVSFTDHLLLLLLLLILLKIIQTPFIHHFPLSSFTLPLFFFSVWAKRHMQWRMEDQRMISCV